MVGLVGGATLPVKYVRSRFTVMAAIMRQVITSQDLYLVPAAGRMLAAAACNVAPSEKIMNLSEKHFWNHMVGLQDSLS